MFQTITSDLTEFASCLKKDTSSAVNVVAQDAISTLDKIDAVIGSEKPSDAEQEAIYRMGLREIYLTPLAAVNDEDKCGDESEMFDADQAKEFCATFDIGAKTDEISELLRQNDELRTLFEELVPVEVPYSLFWERFFFRCDAARIQEAWDFQNELEKRRLREKLQTVKNIAAVPGRVMNGVVVQPVNYLAKQVVFSSFSVVSAITGIQSTSKQSSTEQKCSRQELEDLQMAITASNERIASLRQKLDSTRKQLEVTETTSRSLETELASAKAALDEKENHAKALESRIQGITISVDNTSTTASSTEISGFEESSNGEDDVPSIETALETAPSDLSSSAIKSSRLIAATIYEDESRKSCSDDDDDSESGWTNDEHSYNSDLAILMM